MNKKKVLFILQDFSGGGAERVFINIANGYYELGHHVTFILGQKSGVYFDAINKNIEIQDIKARTIFSYIQRLIAVFKKTDYTHIFTASDNISIAAVIAKKIAFNKSCLICTLHYNLPFILSTLPLKNKLWVTFTNKYIIAKANKMVAVSNGVAEGFREAIKKQVPHLSVIYNPVFDNGIYAKSKEPIEESLFKNGKTTLINIGRLIEQKNKPLLLHSFAKVKKQEPNIQLVILGEGSLLNSLKKLAQDLQISEDVYFLGFKQNPYKYLANSHLFVLSSFFEGLPTVIIEALAIGTNVVSTNCKSGPFEILEAGKNGWLSGVNNSDSLAEKIMEALSAPKPANQLIEAAQKYHNANIITKYNDLLDSY